MLADLALADAPPRTGRALVADAVARAAPESLADVLARWDALLPDGSGEGWQHFLADLRRNKMGLAAFWVAKALADSMPGEAWLVLEMASLCETSVSKEEMLATGQRAFAAAPDNPIGPRLIVNALRALNRGPELAAFHDGLPPLFAREDWYLFAGLHIAWAAGDYEGALAYAAELRREAPGRPSGFILASMIQRQRQALTQAEEIIQQALERLPGLQDVWVEGARVAQAAGKNALAFERWAELRRRFPETPAGFSGALELAQQVGLPDAEIDLAEQAVEAFPSDLHILALAARNAMLTGDAERAAQRWQQAIGAAPHDPALRLRAAMSLFGRGPMRRRRLAATVDLLAGINTDFPDFIPACQSRLALLRDAKRLDEAEQVAADWTRRFPAHVGLAVEHARVAEARGDVGRAMNQLADVRKLITRDAALEVAFTRLLSMTGHHDEALAICRDALETLPQDAALLSEHANLAMRRGEWVEARRRAEAALRVRPDHAGLRDLLHRANLHCVSEAPVSSTGDRQHGSHASQRDPQSAALLLRFESLGATNAGCEFGIVQRQAGCEPLGLLRWAKISFKGLIAALDNEFAGVGDAENTELAIRDEAVGQPEYSVKDDRLGYSTHTFVRVEDIDFDRMFKQSLRRLSFLRGKLIEDLRAGEKIFVYKLGARRTSRVELVKLHDAVCRYAPATLLCASKADAEYPKGTLRMLRPGLFHGTFGTFMGIGRAGGAGIDHPQWRTFCQEVADWHDTNAAAHAASAAPRFWPGPEIGRMGTLPALSLLPVSGTTR